MKAQIPYSGNLNSRTFAYGVANSETPTSSLSFTDDQACFDSAQIFSGSLATNRTAADLSSG
jgi:hypothetical protein